MGVTSSGGEVVILDTAAYGAVTITKGIKIIGPSGVYGAVTVFGGANPTAGITINAPPTDDVTLTGLNISGLPGAAPLPLYGINIQSAGTVHIDHVTVSNFTDPAGACINVAPSASVIVYLNDSSMRECRTGINGDGTAVPTSGEKLAVLIDSTRIERGRATSGPVWGFWLHGYAGASVRNSQISIQDVGIQIDNLATNQTVELALSQMQLVGTGIGLNVSSTSAGAVPVVFITGSRLFGGDDAVIFSHTAAGTSFGAQLKVADSSFEHQGNGGITLLTGADAVVNMDLVRSQVLFTGNTAINLAASGTSGVNFNMRDSTLSNALTLLKTSGVSGINATLIRSHLHNSNIAVDHGRGRIRMEQTDVSNNSNGLVNNGSPNIESAGNNWILDNVDTTFPPGQYITVNFVPMK